MTNTNTNTELSHTAQLVAKVIEERPNTKTEWVGIADIIRKLPFSKGEIHRALIELAGTGGYDIIPESNQKTLREIDRRYALRIGGQYRHYISPRR